MARARGKVRGRDGWYCFLLLIDMVRGPGVGSFTPPSERSEHRGIWCGGELVPVYSSPGGDKDHERANTAEYWSVKSLGRSGASVEWRTTISYGSKHKVSDSSGAELAERKENDWCLGIK
jgi:hypothetical protein